MMTPQRHRDRYVRLVSAIAFVLASALSSSVPFAQSTSAPGGFVEDSTSTATRPRLSAAQIAAFLPARGRFLFPAPYGTEGIRLTNDTDCARNADCVGSVGYSYWRNINNHVGSPTLLVMLVLDPREGGSGPTLFRYDKNTGVVSKLGAIVPTTSVLYDGTGEGWYFSATNPTALYATSGARLFRVDVLAKTEALVLDVTSHFGANRLIWQVHSSHDDTVHSFTLKESPSYNDLGCGVYFEATRQTRFYPARAGYDECQIDKSGRYLLVKENYDGVNGEDNVIYDLANGPQQVILDPDGAGGHSDNGFGYLVAEDNWNQLPGAVRVWTFGGGVSPQGRLVFHGTDWNLGDNHVSHSNARADLTLSQQHVCSSNANRNILPHANEVLCYRLDGSLKYVVAAPIMTDLNARGGGDDYSKLPKGNLDVTGEYFIWTTNMGGSRQDAFIVRVPLGKLPPPLDGSPVPTMPGTPSGGTSTAPPPAVAVPVNWTGLTNVTLTNGVLRKNGGCSGCADAGAVSSQTIGGGEGYVEFTTGKSTGMYQIGLSAATGFSAVAEFSLLVKNGLVEVHEGGVTRASLRAKPNDTLRIEVAGGQVKYLKGTTVFYTSLVAPASPLRANAVLFDLNASTTSAVIAGQ